MKKIFIFMIFFALFLPKIGFSATCIYQEYDGPLQPADDLRKITNPGL